MLLRLALASLRRIEARARQYARHLTSGGPPAAKAKMADVCIGLARRAGGTGGGSSDTLIIARSKGRGCWPVMSIIPVRVVAIATALLRKILELLKLATGSCQLVLREAQSCSGLGCRICCLLHDYIDLRTQLISNGASVRERLLLSSALLTQGISTAGPEIFSFHQRIASAR